jgi:hypothetical protein
MTSPLYKRVLCVGTDMETWNNQTKDTSTFVGININATATWDSSIITWDSLFEAWDGKTGYANSPKDSSTFVNLPIH